MASRELWMQKAEAWLLPAFGTGRLEPALEVLFELQKLPRSRVTLRKREWYDLYDAAAALVLWFMVTTPLASVTGVMFPPLPGNLNGCFKDTCSDSDVDVLQEVDALLHWRPAACTSFAFDLGLIWV